MKREISNFILLCKQSQIELKALLVNFLKVKGYNPIVDDGYIYAEGSDVCLTAHLDTVHKELVKKVNVIKDDIVSSPQGIGGDDRCGVYMILEIIKKGFHPTVLFCEDEEIGGIGSNKFVRTRREMPVKFFIELDRAHATDLVFYNDDNIEFHDWCEKVTGYKTNYGSFSDISHLCPHFEISGVNVSCGYYGAHTLQEYVVFSEMENSIEATIKLIEAAKELSEPWKYKETPLKFWDTGYSDYSWYGEWAFITEDGEKHEAYGTKLSEAVGEFLMENPDIKWNDIVDYYNYDEIYFRSQFKRQAKV